MKNITETQNLKLNYYIHHYQVLDKNRRNFNKT